MNKHEKRNACRRFNSIIVFMFIAFILFNILRPLEDFSTLENRYLKKISTLATIDVIFLLAWNVILFGWKYRDLHMFLVCLLIDFMGIVIAVIFAALSHLVGKAADLQEQSDYTI